MKITLNAPFAANGAVDPFDVKQMKKALNRLGYYQPYEKVGITDIPDGEVFAALKQFQEDHNMPGTARAKPGDETIQKINEEAAKTPEGQYIWRTVEDEKVRKGHEELNRTLRDWSDSPDPGEEFNCRCWAERISDAIEKEELQPPKFEIPKIPGTDIPDRGIPEQGWQGSKDFDPFKAKPDPRMDPDIIVIPPDVDPYMPIYEDIPWRKRDKDV